MSGVAQTVGFASRSRAYASSSTFARCKCMVDAQRLSSRFGRVSCSWSKVHRCLLSALEAIGPDRQCTRRWSEARAAQTSQDEPDSLHRSPRTVFQ